MSGLDTTTGPDSREARAGEFGANPYNHKLLVCNNETIPRAALDTILKDLSHRASPIPPFVRVPVKTAFPFDGKLTISRHDVVVTIAPVLECRNRVARAKVPVRL